MTPADVFVLVIYFCWFSCPAHDAVVQNAREYATQQECKAQAPVGIKFGLQAIRRSVPQQFTIRYKATCLSKRSQELRSRGIEEKEL